MRSATRFAAPTGGSFADSISGATNSQAGPLCRWLLHNGPVFLWDLIKLDRDRQPYAIAAVLEHYRERVAPSWRMPTTKQMEKLATEAARKPGPSAAAPDAPLPAEYWELVLKDPRAGATGAQMRKRRLSEIQRHVLRVACRRCRGTVEIQTADAVRLYGGNAVWKDVAQRLDNTCQQRTGSHEEDGCWPVFETP